MIEKRKQIENAIFTLKELLDKQNVAEHEFQKWFELNEIVFTALNFKNNISQPRLHNYKGEELIPDFMVQNINNTWEIFELKLPYEKVLKDKLKRQIFYAKANEYIQQCIDYSEFFNDHTNRENFSLKYEIEIKFAPRTKLVIGRDAGLNRYELNKSLDLSNRSIDIITYDDVIRQLEFLKVNTLGNYENLNGLTASFIANIHELKSNNYIVSLGKYKDKNNVSIFLNKKGDLCFQIIDENKNIFTNIINKQETGFQYNKMMYFTFEIGIDNEKLIVSSEINGNYGSISFFNTKNLDFDDLLEYQVIGSDACGQENGFFDLTSHMIWSKTLLLEERIGIRNRIIHFDLKKGSPDQYISFYANRFFYKNSNNNFKKNKQCKPNDLVQMVGKNQPELAGKNIQPGQLYLPVFFNQTSSEE